jgi:hypothetical protein
MSAMKSRNDVIVELVKVRSQLAKLRADGEEGDTSLLYGAQQALVWMLNGGGMSPSELHDLIYDLVEEFGDV